MPEGRWHYPSSDMQAIEPHPHRGMLPTQKEASDLLGVSVAACRCVEDAASIDDGAEAHDEDEDHARSRSGRRRRPARPAACARRASAGWAPAEQEDDSDSEGGDGMADTSATAVGSSTGMRVSIISALMVESMAAKTLTTPTSANLWSATSTVAEQPRPRSTDPRKHVSGDLHSTPAATSATSTFALASSNAS
jgi:hypothetical protein